MCSGSRRLQGSAAAAVVSSSAPMSVEEYVERISLEKRNIAIKTPSEIADIAGKIQSWELIAHLLGILYPQVEAIRNDHQGHYEEQKLAMILVYQTTQNIPHCCMSPSTYTVGRFLNARFELQFFYNSQLLIPIKK